MVKENLTRRLDNLSDFLAGRKKILPPKQVAKVEELLKQIEETKQCLPDEFDKIMAELKIDEIFRDSKTGVTLLKRESQDFSDKELRKLSEEGDKHATYEKNREKVEKAQQSGNSSRIKYAHGARVENQIADELSDRLVKAGEEVKYPNPSNPNRILKSEIDLETDTEVIQIKSGKDLPEPRQIQTTIYHAEQVGKRPVVYYNELTVPGRAVQEFEKAYPQVKLVPRKNF